MAGFALEIRDRVGRYEKFINGRYEPMQMVHNKKGCWVARDDAIRGPRYLFHTGKSRWVISSRIDDGTRCWIYRSGNDGSMDPSDGGGIWNCIDEDGSWSVDSKVKCEQKPAATDQYIQARLKMEHEMRKLGLIDSSYIRQMWRRASENGNDFAKLTQVHKMVDDFVKRGAWPSKFNNVNIFSHIHDKTIVAGKKEADRLVAQTRAVSSNPAKTTAATEPAKPAVGTEQEADKGKPEMTAEGNKQLKLGLLDNLQKTSKTEESALIHKQEFHRYMLHVYWFHKLWQSLDEATFNKDKGVDDKMMKRGFDDLQIPNTSDFIAKEFASMSEAAGDKGKPVQEVPFIEYCKYVRQRIHPDFQAEFDADLTSPEVATKSIRKLADNKHTSDSFWKIKTWSDFNMAEVRLRTLLQDDVAARFLWDRVDFNGNGFAPVDEIDRYLAQEIPVLNHRPALSRACIKTTGGGGRSDWVQKKEIKRFMVHAFVFNKLYWLFDQVEGEERRMKLEDFKLCSALCGSDLKEEQLEQEFREVDSNRGGTVTFDDFCVDWAKKKWSEVMTDLS